MIVLVQWHRELKTRRPFGSLTLKRVGIGLTNIAIQAVQAAARYQIQPGHGLIARQLRLRIAGFDELLRLLDFVAVVDRQPHQLVTAGDRHAVAEAIRRHHTSALTVNIRGTPEQKLKRILALDVQKFGRQQLFFALIDSCLGHHHVVVGRHTFLAALPCVSKQLLRKLDPFLLHGNVLAGEDHIVILLHHISDHRRSPKLPLVVRDLCIGFGNANFRQVGVFPKTSQQWLSGGNAREGLPLRTENPRRLTAVEAVGQHSHRGSQLNRGTRGELINQRQLAHMITLHEDVRCSQLRRCCRRDPAPGRNVILGVLRCADGLIRIASFKARVERLIGHLDFLQLDQTPEVLDHDVVVVFQRFQNHRTQAQPLFLGWLKTLRGHDKDHEDWCDDVGNS